MAVVEHSLHGGKLNALHLITLSWVRCFERDHEFSRTGIDFGDAAGLSRYLNPMAVILLIARGCFWDWNDCIGCVIESVWHLECRLHRLNCALH